MHGKLMPYEDCFCGNTAINYHGEYLAIWDVECDPPVDMDSFAASLVHEMFHCHQFSCGEERFPSDLAILAHPGNLEYFSTDCQRCIFCKLCGSCICGSNYFKPDSAEKYGD